MQEQTQHEGASNSENSEQVSEKDLLAQIEQLKSTNERLLQESSKYKTRKSEVDEIREQLESYKKKELEQKGNFQEMLKMEQEKRMQLQNELEQRDKKLLKSNIFNAVSNYAKDAYDVNDLLAQRDYASMIEIDEDNLEPVAASIQRFVDTLKEEKKYLFKGNKVASMADTKPAIDKPIAKNLAQMSDQERRQHMKQLLSSVPLTK